MERWVQVTATNIGIEKQRCWINMAHVVAIEPHEPGLTLLRFGDMDQDPLEVEESPAQLLAGAINVTGRPESENRRPPGARPSPPAGRFLRDGEIVKERL